MSLERHGLGSYMVYRLLFKKFFFIYLLLFVVGLPCCVSAVSSCGEQGLFASCGV